MTTDEWLSSAGSPGRRWFRLAGAALTLETVLAVARWGGLAYAAGGALEGRAGAVIRGVAIVLGASALAALSAYAAGHARERGAREVRSGLRRRLVDALLPTALRHRDPDPAGAALAIVDLVEDIADYHATVAPQRFSAPLSTVAVLAVTAVLHWPAAIVLALSTALIPLNLRLAGLFAQQGADRQLAATERLNAVVLDSFRGLTVLRELGATGRRGRALATAASQLNVATMSVLRRAFLSGMVMDVVITFSIAATATYTGLSLLGYVHVPHAPALTLFTGLLVLLVCPMYFTPLRELAAAYHQRERAMVAAGAVASLVGDTVESPEPERSPAPTEAVGVSLSGVRYRYPDSEQDTVHADLTLGPGTWTVLTGPSGAGKSTLLSLVAGSREPSAGAVVWDTATGPHQPSLGECAWVGQQTVLLDVTVRENIRLGRPHASERELLRAVEAAGLAPVVDRLRDGLDTRLGERGVGLSTGEVRRIAIARAFLRGARLWLLDEPTAHLDPDSEHEVVEALRRATHGCTVLVATHSPALASAADDVLTIDQGFVREVLRV